MIIESVRYCLGYVRFSIKGEFPERLLNQLALGGVSVWGIKRQGKVLTACILKRDYLQIRQYRSKNRVTTRIIARYGLPFRAHRYRYRIGFAVGLALYISALGLMSQFVWNIRIVGNEQLSEDEILTVCEEIGLKEGALKGRLNTEQLRTELALKLHEVAWASVNIEGVKATVNISENIGNKNPEKVPCNLIAECDGVVTALEVTSGAIAVKVGQTVKKGDLLVSGVTEYKDGTYFFGVSAGEVKAETVREAEIFVPFCQSETVSVGEPQKKRVLTVFGLNIPLYLGSVKGDYETESECKFYDDGQMYLPIYLTETLFQPVAEREYVLTEAEAKSQAMNELDIQEKEEFEDKQILSKETDFEVSDAGVTLKVTYKCRENIAKQDLLLILE